ncbi:MAG: Soluble lytic murein transglycosylase precursor [Myxococcaceae bacterium]|nr:Soluble lytic murein transglycosylase precursor [Myxococcaceae bacterium]
MCGLAWLLGSVGSPTPAAGSPAHAEKAPAKLEARDGNAPVRGEATEDKRDDSRFDPDSIRAAKGSARKAALEARAAGNPAEARARALAALPQARGDEAAYLRWIAGQTSRELGDPPGCAELLMPLANGDHPLAIWAKLTVAECLEGRDPLHALALLDSLLAPSRDVQGWPGRTPAERARARVLDKLGRREDAVLAFERMASDARDESAMVQVLLPLAELLAQGSESERVRAYSLTRRVAVRYPETRAGRRAVELGAALLKTLPVSVQEELQRPRLEDKFVRADAIAAELRYADAGSAYLEIEQAAKDQPEVACRARYGRAKSLLDRRARAEGSVLMAEVAEHCVEDTDRRAWARYLAGRAFSSLGQNEQAIAQFEALEREAPNHSLADDALYRAARTAHDMGDTPGLISRLNLIFERYPQGDMHLRARFALAWEAFSQGDLMTAIQTVSVDERDEATEDLQGRSSYFRARWLGDAGNANEAIDGFAATFEHNPLSYFGQLAHARLMALAPERAHELSAKLARARNVRLTFAPRPELSSIGFRRAFALFSVNEVSLATWELKTLGFTGEGADVELALLSVALLDRANAPEQALEVARRHMPRLMRRAPVGGDVALYELVYPVAFSQLIEKAAKKEGAPPAFVRAVAREESGFNPDAVSRAHAYGLVQILVPTAKLLVKTKAERVRDGKALLKPELNLTLGARFMAGLAASFHHQYALVPPAYNAGPGAVARWLKERGHEPLDVWVENIPYDETRGYTRRVLQSYGVYQWLANHEMLHLSLEPTGGPQRSSTAASAPNLTSVSPSR